jgi:hypothetical protein
MKLVTHLACLAALVAAPLATACSHHGSDDASGVSDSDLTGTMGIGTYVVGTPPFGSTYPSRLTFAAGQKFEAEIISGSGDTSVLAGSYVILPAHPNDPQSPIATDKPTLVLSSDSGEADLSFELDKLPGGVLRLYASARQVSFTMTKDPSWQPAPTNQKVIVCTGNGVDTRLTLDQAQNRRGTLQLTRKPSAGHGDPPASVTVTVTLTEPEDPAYVYFEGTHGEQDYYANIKQDDFDRGHGSVEMNLRWAQGGQEWSIGATCAFAP